MNELTWIKPLVPDATWTIRRQNIERWIVGRRAGDLRPGNWIL